MQLDFTAGPGAFVPAWWCRGPHLQTLWPHLLRRSPRPTLQRTQLNLPDGDILELDWFKPDAARPLVIILHGLEGSSRSHYVRGMIAACARAGWQAVVMHFRGCGGSPNRLPRSYHSGETGDLNYFINQLRQQ